MISEFVHCKTSITVEIFTE